MPETETLDETQEAPERDVPPAPEPDEEDAADDDEQPGEPERESEPPAGPSQTVLDARRAKGEKASAAWEKKIRGIYEEEATELFACPLCPDAHRGFLNVNDAGRFPPEVVKAAQEFLGVTQEADYVRDPDYARCSSCDGLGNIDTDSRVPQWKHLLCRKCSGHGFIGPGDVAPQGNGAGHYEQIGATGQAVSPVQDDADAWGSPRLLPDGTENPNYGRMPQYKSGQWP